MKNLRLFLVAFVVMLGFSACVSMKKYKAQTAEVTALKAQIEAMKTQMEVQCPELKREVTSLKLQQKEQEERTNMVVKSASQKVAESEARSKTSTRRIEKIARELKKSS